MELFLNLAWVCVAVASVCLWFRLGDETVSERRRQVIALGVLIAILFPVISVSDDLLAVQSAAETDSCMRRDHLVPSSAHAILPIAGVVPPSIFDGLPFGFLRFASVGSLPIPALQHPEREAVQNRPPPAA